MAEPRREGNYCLQCGALDFERARPQCKNPLWHLPNYNEPRERTSSEESKEAKG